MSSSLNQHISARMIPRTPTSWQHAPWQKLLAAAITKPEELLVLLKLDELAVSDVQQASKAFSLRVPRAYVALMQSSNPHDPLLRQILPISEELKIVDGYKTDPVGDLVSAKAPGVLQKYHGRVLLIATGACAINCRYCFRRHFPYQEQSAHRSDWDQAIQHIAQDTSLSEVILSGGDPLLLNDRQLQSLIHTIEAIPHIKRLRIHSRLPVVLPERTTPELAHILSSSRLQPVIIIHANHPNEMGESAQFACNRLHQAGITLLNQSVLLEGVNADAQTLAELSERLFESRVLPYYLHMLDPVQGAAHFDVTEEKARNIHKELQRRLPGYLVPRLVRELEGEPSKTSVRI